MVKCSPGFWFILELKAIRIAIGQWQRWPECRTGETVQAIKYLPHEHEVIISRPNTHIKTKTEHAGCICNPSPEEVQTANQVTSMPVKDPVWQNKGRQFPRNTTQGCPLTYTHTHKHTEPQFPGSVLETCIHVWAHSNVLHLASCVNLCKIRKEEHWGQRRQKKTPLVSHFHSLSTLLLGKCINLIKTKCNSNAPIWFKNNLHSRQDIKIQLRLFEESLRCILCCEAALCQETQTFLNVTNVFSSLPLAQMPLPIRF